MYPAASRDIKEQTYVDDELVAAEDKEKLIIKTKQMDEISSHANMHNKGWVYSGDNGSGEVQIGSAAEDERVLGMLWSPSSDNFYYKVKLILKIRGDKGIVDVIIYTVDELKEHEVNIVLTRRIVLSNVSKIFDPAGFLCMSLYYPKCYFEKVGKIRR